MTTIAALDCVGGGREQLVVKQWQGLFKMRREPLLSGLTNPLEPFDPVAQLPELTPSGVRPTTAVKQGIDVFHDLAQFPQMRQASGDGHESVTFGRGQVALDEHKAVL